MNDTNLKAEVSHKITRILYELSDISKIFVDHSGVIEFYKKLDETIDYIERLFSNPEINVNEVLGGEIINNDSLILPQKKSMPLFLYLDMYAAINNYLIKYAEQYVKIEPLLHQMNKQINDKIRMLKTKAVKLPHNNLFSPDKQLDTEIGKIIFCCNGRFSIDNEDRDGIEYFIIRYIPIEYSRQSFHKYDSKLGKVTIDFLYLEDRQQYEYSIEKKKREKTENKLKEYENIIKIYFKDEKIPESTDDFHPSLVDIDKDLQISLFASFRHYLICVRRKKITDDFEKSVENLKLEITKNKNKENVEEQTIQQPPKKVEEIKETRKKTSFGEFIQRLTNITRGRKNTESDHEATRKFEEAREQQLIMDSSGRKYVVAEVVTQDGKNIYIPMSDKEVKVMRK